MERKTFNNPFRRANENQQTKSKKELEWGKVKFNPVARAAVTEQATPWAHFKSDLINQQGKSTLENDVNVQEILKQREQNYRKNLILSKQKEPTQWEDFSDDPQPESSMKNKNKKQRNNRGNFQDIPSTIQNRKSIKKRDFDSKSLTTDQSMYIKRFITKNYLTQQGSSLKSATNVLKNNGAIQKLAKKKLNKKHGKMKK